jgi:hypothetical protein
MAPDTDSAGASDTSSVHAPQHEIEPTGMLTPAPIESNPGTPNWLVDGGASLWQAEQLRSLRLADEESAWKEYAAVLQSLAADDEADTFVYESTPETGQVQYAHNWSLIKALLEKEGLVGQKLSFQAGDEEVLLQQVLNMLAIECDRSEFLAHLITLQQLVKKEEDNLPLGKRLRGEHCTVTWQNLEDHSLGQVSQPADPFVPFHVIPKPGKRRQASAMAQVETVKDEENRMKKEIADKIIFKILETDHPNAVAARRTEDPSKILLGAMGDTRASTMMIYIRVWERMTAWLNFAKGLNWPSEALNLVEYLHHAVTEPCSRTHPQSLLQAVSWLERTAGIIPTQMLSRDSLVQKTVEYCTGLLSVGALPMKQAARLPSVCIAALECFICDPVHSPYLRFRAFTICFKVWATLRQDDIQHFSLSNFRRVGNFFAGELLQTKTTGPTKRVKEVPLVIAENASITGLPWLVCGLSLATEFDIKKRDYLLPECASGGHGFGPRMAKYAAASAASLKVMQSLKVPEVELKEGRVNWCEGQAQLLPPEMVKLWSEHSPRACMPSWTSLMAVEKSVRDLLGRWSPTGSEDYTRTFRMTVRELQLAVVRAIRSKDERLTEEDILEKLKRHMAENEDIPGRAHYDEVCIKWREICTAFQKKLVQHGPDWQDKLDEQFVSRDGLSEPPAVPTEQGKPLIGNADYVIVYSKGRRFARLHSVHSNCPWNKLDLTDNIAVHVPLPEMYNARCKICWPNTCQEQVEMDSDQFESDEGDLE